MTMEMVLIDVAGRPDALFDYLALLQLVDPDLIDPLDLARPVTDVRTADAAGV